VPGPAQGDEAHRVLSSLKNDPKKLFKKKNIIIMTQ
jgi:hypothetical protein